MCAVALVLSLVTAVMAAPNAPVEQWGVYEVQLKGPTNGNPFVDVRLSAVFDNGNRTVKFPASTMAKGSTASASLRTPKVDGATRPRPIGGN
jgi:hypothetical protein